jgi:hypothetical protein
LISNGIIIIIIIIAIIISIIAIIIIIFAAIIIIIIIIIISTHGGEEEHTYRLLVGKSEGKRPPGRPRHRCLDNIRMGLVGVELGDVDWIGLA